LVIDVALADGFAYLANGDPGFRIIDVSDPTVPDYVALLRMPGTARGVAVSGNYAYVAVDNVGLQVVDITDRYEPVLGALLETPDPYRVTVSGDYAYVADLVSGLLIVDISDPRSPVLLGSVDSRSWARRAFVQGDLAFVAVGEAGLQIVDVSNPIPVATVGSLSTDGHSFGLDMAGESVYLADGGDGLKVVNVSDPEHPEDWGSVAWGGDAGHVVLDDHNSPHYAYVGDLMTGLVVVDVVTNEIPTVVGTPLPLNGPIHGLAIDGNHAYVGDPDGLQVVNISNPESLWVEATVATDNECWGVAVSGDTAFMAVVSDGLCMVDISDPAIPEFLGYVDTPGTARAVAVSGNYAFVGDHLGLAVVNISAGEVVAYLDTPGIAYSVTLRESLAYVADVKAGLLVVDVSDPENPVVIGNVDTVWAEQAVVTEDFVFLSDYTAGLRVLPAQCSVADVPDGMGDPTTTKLALSFRNPAVPNGLIGYRLENTALVDLRIFDAAGGLVRVLEDGVPRSPGVHQVLWDGDDDFGNGVPAGIYFYRLEAGTVVQTRKATLLR
jgi:hypothetical protein